jgi:hypothetical protein
MINRRKFIRNVATGLFVPSVLYANKSEAASGMIINPFGIIRATHASATAWSAQVVTNGGAAPSASSVSAVSNFFYELDAASFTYSNSASMILFYNAFAPDSLIAAMTPQINVAGVAWTNRNFVLSDLTVNGLKGNGTNKSIATPYIPGNWWTNLNAGLSVYSSTTVAENSFEMGVGGSNFNSQFGINVNWSNGTCSCECWRFDSPNTVIANLPSSPIAGWCSFSRILSNDLRMFFANSTNAHAQIGSTQTGAQNGAAAQGGTQALEIFAINANGSLSNWTTRRLSCVAGHVGLVLVDNKTLYDRTVNLRTAFGGGTV